MKLELQDKVDFVEAIIQLALKHKLDLLEVDGIKVVKTKHEMPQEIQPVTKPLTKEQMEDEILFGDYSRQETK